jgi:hypothetical protein
VTRAALLDAALACVIELATMRGLALLRFTADHADVERRWRVARST